jgi:type IV pilus assembly protein PilM
VIGLEIQSDVIKLIHLNHIKQKLRVERMEILALPENAIAEGKIQLPDQITTCLYSLVQRLKIQNYPAVLALPVQSIISRQIQFKKQYTQSGKSKEIIDSVSSYFPGLIQDLCYDYTMLPMLEAKKERALFVAARSEQLNDYVTVVTRAGLCVKIVDVDIYALVRAARFATSLLFSLVAILNIEPVTAQFVFLQNNEISYHHQFEYCSLDELLEKLSGIMQLCCSTHQVASVETILLSCSPDVMPELVNKIEKHLSVNVHVINPFELMLHSATVSAGTMCANAARMMVSCGLAMRRMPKW